MINQSLKKKVTSNKLTIGSWITIGNPSIPEIMSQADFEFLVIDIQHGIININQVQDMIMAIESFNITPLVRVTSNNVGLIAQCMDAGAYGVIVPLVNNKSDAIDAVKSTKYPPDGNRSTGLARAQGYGFQFDQYKKNANKFSTVIVQIEHKDSIENIEEILSVNDIDGYMIGPYDLSASMNKSYHDMDHGEIERIEKDVISVAKKNNKIAGYHIVHPDKNIIKNKIKMGYRFIVVGSDNIYLGNSCINTMNDLKGILWE